VKRALLLVLGAGLALRVGYVALQPHYDPTFAHPILDGAYYVAAARAIVAGTAATGVYYMPPLYPWALSVFQRIFGDSWALLYLLQQAAIVASAGLLATAARRVASPAAGLATAAIVLLYHPPMYFASAPLGESLALCLMSVSVVFALRSDERSGATSGLALGLASLARPNFLPLIPLWVIHDLIARRWRRAALVAAAAAIAILPAACHNYRASGRLVPVSANGGVVFWLGNGPGAEGVYTPTTGFSGSLQTQQDEAIAEASARSGRTLDAVGADGFWWGEGLRVRAADPSGSAMLLLRRLLLTVDNAEHGLDYAPALDPNPLRFGAPLPFALILALAVFAIFAVGWDKSGGFAVWSAVLVAAAAPIAFYVSSRHRLPFAVLLAVPAGAGLAAVRSERRARSFVAGAGALLLSLAVPSGDYARTEEAGALSVLSEVQLKAGQLDEAAATARRATDLDRANAIAWFNRGVIEAARGRTVDAESAYRGALTADPAQPDAAANLAGILVVGGRAAEAAPLLERALASWPRHAVAWSNLVVAYAATGDFSRARAAADRAKAAGVTLDPGLLSTLEEHRAQEGR
jgi:tetratricopeptide (TPR) repeat protein